mmetsp:Transcript_10730/g.34325  ORF Transcript_10730/g.34325 Transcript_10730/m.34325 type:complete len:131 (+) Transcript_10730:316-708(+)
MRAGKSDYFRRAAMKFLANETGWCEFVILGEEDKGGAAVGFLGLGRIWCSRTTCETHRRRPRNHRACKAPEIAHEDEDIDNIHQINSLDHRLSQGLEMALTEVVENAASYWRVMNEESDRFGERRGADDA